MRDMDLKVLAEVSKLVPEDDSKKTEETVETKRRTKK